MKKALFLDRDGIINKEYNYVHKIEDFDFIPGIFDFCKFFLNIGYIIVVITNQAGIARNYYTIKDFNILTQWMLKEFQKRNIEISKVYHCPHHPEYTGDCDCRKPHPGMLFRAKNEMNINLNESVLVGDKQSDLIAGYNAGLSKENCHLYKGSFADILKQYVNSQA